MGRPAHPVVEDLGVRMVSVEVADNTEMQWARLAPEPEIAPLTPSSCG